MTENAMFQRISEVMNNIVFETYMTSYYRRGIVSERLQYVAIHEEIFNAICNRDPAKASEASKWHMEVNYRELVCSNDAPIRPMLDIFH